MSPVVREGSLVAYDLADLVQELYEQRWTGRALLTRRTVECRLCIQEGRLVFAASTDPDDRLGELLLLRGRISLRQFRDASLNIAPGLRLGTVLVQQGILDAHDLVRAVVEHVQEIIYGVFQWTDGNYRLVPGALPAEDITLKLSTPELIAEGLRRVQSWSRIERAVGGPTALYARTVDYEQKVGQMGLSLEKLSLLTELHEPRDVLAICEQSSLSDIDVCRTLWALRVVGALRRVGAREPMALADTEGLGAVLGEE